MARERETENARTKRRDEIPRREREMLAKSVQESGLRVPSQPTREPMHPPLASAREDSRTRTQEAMACKSARDPSCLDAIRDAGATVLPPNDGARGMGDQRREPPTRRLSLSGACVGWINRITSSCRREGEQGRRVPVFTWRRVSGSHVERQSNIRFPPFFPSTSYPHPCFTRSFSSDSLTQSHARSKRPAVYKGCN